MSLKNRLERYLAKNQDKLELRIYADSLVPNFCMKDPLPRPFWSRLTLLQESKVLFLRKMLNLFAYIETIEKYG